MRRFVPILLLLAACGGGAEPSATPPPTSPAPTTPSPAPVETARTIFCGHVRAHINTLLGFIVSPATEDDFAIDQMKDQVKEFREDVNQKEDKDVARHAKDLTVSLQTLIASTETDGLQAAVQQHFEPFADAVGDANSFCGI